MNNQTKEYIVICTCGSKMRLVRNKNYTRYFYSCERFPKCRITQGATNDGKPMGIPADPDTNEKRKELFNKLREYYNFKTADGQNSINSLIKLETNKTNISSLTYGECVKLINKLGGSK